MSDVPGTDLSAVQAFETNAVDEVLTDHDLPSSDADAVLSWGRADVRAQEWTDLSAIINESPASRSAGDQAVYSWFQGVYQQQQITAALDAVNEYLKWSGHTSIDDDSSPHNFGPGGTGYCNYEPPGGESGPFSGTYTDNQDQDCYTPCTDLLTDCTPDYPTVDQFTQWGLYDATQAQTSTPGFYTAIVGASVSMGIGVTAAIGSLALPFGTAIDASGLSGTAIQQAVFPFATRVSWVSSAVRGLISSGDIAAEVAPEVAAGAELASAIAFVVGVAIFFIVSTVLASITLAQNAAVHTDLESALNDAENTPPDLGAQLKPGYGALYSTFIAQTLPEPDLGCTSQNLVEGTTLCANAPTPPASSSSDPAFLVTANGETTLQKSIYSIDPIGYYDNTYMSGNGWFVTQRADNTDPSNAISFTDAGATVQSLSFEYTDWSGNRFAAERVMVDGQPMFAKTPLDNDNPAACDIPAGGTSTSCLTNSIQFTEPNGNGAPIDATAQLESASAADPTVVANYPASISAGQPVTFTASGSDPNKQSLTYSWQLPVQWNGSTFICPSLPAPCVNTLSGATPSYTFTLPGLYHGTVTATDTAGFSSTETFAVTVTDTTTTALSSSANPSVYGQPVTLTADVSPFLAGGNGGFFYPSVDGYVQFTVNGQPLGQPVALQPKAGCPFPCSVPDGFATLTLPNFPATPAKAAAGEDVGANYLGSSTYSASASTGSVGPGGQVTDQAATVTTESSSANPSVAGQPITFSAAVAPIAPGAGRPTGSVQFQYNGQNVGSAVALDSTGSATSPPITVAHATQGGLVLPFGNVSAVYSGDADFATSSDSSLYQTIDTAPTATTVTSSADPSDYLQPVTFTAAVAASAPGSGTPSGQVQFAVDGTPIGSPVNLDATGTATLTTDASDALGLTGTGTAYPTGHVVTAQYLGVPCSGCIYYVPDFGSSTGTLAGGQSVQQPSLLITASSATVTYGAAVPVITPGYQGFVGTDSPTSLTTAPSCATAYQKGNGVASYPTSCQGAVDPAYQILYGTGAVTVGPAALTVTAKNESMAAGAARTRVRVHRLRVRRQRWHGRTDRAAVLRRARPGHRETGVVGHVGGHLPDHLQRRWRRELHLQLCRRSADDQPQRHVAGVRRQPDPAHRCQLPSAGGRVRAGGLRIRSDGLVHPERQSADRGEHAVRGRLGPDGLGPGRGGRRNDRLAVRRVHRHRRLAGRRRLRRGDGVHDRHHRHRRSRCGRRRHLQRAGRRKGQLHVRRGAGGAFHHARVCRRRRHLQQPVGAGRHRLRVRHRGGRGEPHGHRAALLVESRSEQGQGGLAADQDRCRLHGIVQFDGRRQERHTGQSRGQHRLHAGRPAGRSPGLPAAGPRERCRQGVVTPDRTAHATASLRPRTPRRW